MYYDDGYEGEIKVVRDYKSPNFARAYKLSNGDVIQINEMFVEFEDKILYEVIRVAELGDLSTEFVRVTYIRTGRSFTFEQINEMVKR